jgi:putative ABC transport system permease protein
VVTAEGWNLMSASVVRDGTSHEITHTYPDKGHGSFSMLGLPVDTKLLKPTVTQGQWLNTDQRNGVVLNQLSRSAYAIGDSIRLSVQGKVTRWKIMGFTEDLGSPAIAYVSMDDMAAQLNTEGRINTIRIGYADRSRDNASVMNSKIEALLQKEDIAVTSTTPVWRLYNAIAAHMKVLVNSLLAMAILMAVVGTLGLMSTMSMNVLERTREIGVMRAIGATPKKIQGIVISEGLIIGTLSVVMAFVLSLILSYFLGRFIGQMSFRTPLPLTVSFIAFLFWYLIIIVGSLAATLLPARRANRITTREALAYE